MGALIEDRCWQDARTGAEHLLGRRERRAYLRAQTADCGVVTYGDTVYSTDRMERQQFDREVNEYVARFEGDDPEDMMSYCAQVDATAPRGNLTERLLAGALSVIFGGAFIVLVGLALWGWLS